MLCVDIIVKGSDVQLISTENKKSKFIFMFIIYDVLYFSLFKYQAILDGP